MRKLLISILNSFLKPLLVIVFGILVMLIALLLHIYAVPFRYKFHNIMEYIVLISILLVLILGLLFFVDQFPTPVFRQFAIWLATVIIILSTVIVCLMIVWDFFTRRRKDKAVVKARRKQLIEQFGEMKKKQLKREYRKLFPNAFNKMNKTVEQDDYEDDKGWIVSNNQLLEGIDWVIKSNPLLEDPNANNQNDYEGLLGIDGVIRFIPPFYNSDESISEEGEHQTLNEIMDDLFGLQRIKNKIVSIGRKQKKVRERVRKLSKRHISLILRRDIVE